MSMTMLANPGDTIRYMAHDAGHQDRREEAAKLLTVNQVYTIKRVVVSGFKTRVWVEGVDYPAGFNSLFFDDVEIDPVLLAARKECARDYDPTKMPIDTDKTSMVDTIYAVRAFLKAVMFGNPAADMDDMDDEEKDYIIGIVLLASIQVGPDVEKIVEFTGLPYGDVLKYHQSAVKYGIFTPDGQVSCDWFNEDGGTMALLCDILVVRGILAREEFSIDDA